MGWYQDWLLPRMIDYGLRAEECSAQRTHTVRGLRGTVLEIGFGSGLNLPHYPPEVSRVLAVDPATEGRKLARPRLAQTRAQVEFIGLDGQALPLEDGSVDCALSTWTLCTIPDVARALGEVRRVLKPGGALHFLEHGRAPEPSVARWQARLNPLQKRVGGGCHLDRPIDALVREAGFDLAQLDTFYLPKTPRLMGFMYRGVARA